MEIYSPGGMPSGEFIQDLDTRAVPSTRRNPVIADLFQRLDLMERRGSGFGKVLDAYEFESKKRGIVVKPVFRSTATGFFVILPNLNRGFSMTVRGGKTATGTVMDTTPETTPETTLETTADKIVGESRELKHEIVVDDVGGTLAEMVGRNAAKAMRMIERDNRITVAEIGRRLNLTLDGAKYNVKKLRAAKLIRFVGNPKSGHWEIGDGRTSARSVLPIAGATRVRTCKKKGARR